MVAGATATLSEVDRRQRELYTKQQLLLRELQRAPTRGRRADKDW